jgi:predicted ATP-dependent protease
MKKSRDSFQACRAKGFTGKQGVIVPARNAAAVILPDAVIQAVEAGRFHIWAAETIDEVMALLTGVKAGRNRRNDRFERHSVNEQVRHGLAELAELS